MHGDLRKRWYKPKSSKRSPNKWRLDHTKGRSPIAIGHEIPLIYSHTGAVTTIVKSMKFSTLTSWRATPRTVEPGAMQGSLKPPWRSYCCFTAAQECPFLCQFSSLLLIELACFRFDYCSHFKNLNRKPTKLYKKKWDSFHLLQLLDLSECFNK